MKIDLKKAFFERDLTDSEDDLLAQEIASSTEASMRFAEYAKAAYAATGLPKPEWGSSTGGAAGLPGMIKCLSIGVLLSGGVWWICTHLNNILNPRASSGTQDTLVSSLPDNNAQGAQTGVLGDVKRNHVSEDAAPYSATGSGTESASESTAAKAGVSGDVSSGSIAGRPGQPGMAKPESYVPGRKYGGLSVVVSRKSEGLVTIRVLDPGKKEVRLLYAGMLEAGEWNFEWDGRLQDGSPAAPGNYIVETQSGPAVLQKKIKIGAE